MRKREIKPRRFRTSRFESLELRHLLSTTVGHLVWHDLNGDGIQDPGEPGVEGVAVALFSSADDVIGNENDATHGAQITDAAGEYSFEDLNEQTAYYLQFRTPVGSPAYGFAPQGQGDDDSLDSDADAFGRTGLFTLGPGSDGPVISAGLTTGIAPDFGFAFSLGEDGGEGGRAVDVDHEGNVFVVGNFQGRVDFDPGPGLLWIETRRTSAFAAKYSSAGALVWARDIGSASETEGVDIKVADDGSVFVAGDVFLTKLDPHGKVIWERQSDGTQRIAVGQDGSLYTIGEFEGQLKLGTGPAADRFTSAGHSDIIFSKLDADGNRVWVRQIGGNGGEDADGIAVAADGSVYVTGTFQDTVDFDSGTDTYHLTSEGNKSKDVFIMKLDAQDDLVWVRQIGLRQVWVGRGSVSAKDLALAGDGNILLTGYFSGAVDFDPGEGAALRRSDGSGETFLVKLDEAGQFVWARQIGGPGLVFGSTIAVAQSGAIFLGGEQSGTVDFDPRPGVHNVPTGDPGSKTFVARFTDVGALEWVRHVTSKTPVRLDLAVGDDESVYATGDLLGTSDFDPGPERFQLTAEVIQSVDWTGRLHSSDGHAMFLLKWTPSGPTQPGGDDPGTDDPDNEPPRTNVFGPLTLEDGGPQPEPFELTATDVPEFGWSWTSYPPIPTIVDRGGAFYDPDPGDSLTYTIEANTNPEMVSAAIVDGKLVLAYVPYFSGQNRKPAQIWVRATDQAGAYAEYMQVVDVSPKKTVNVRLVIREEPTSSGIAPNPDLPQMSQFDYLFSRVGQTYAVEVWVEDTLADSTGVSEINVELDFDSQLSVGNEVVLDTAFDNSAWGTIDNDFGRAVFGGVNLESDGDDIPISVRLGYVEFTVLRGGEQTFTIDASYVRRHAGPEVHLSQVQTWQATSDHSPTRPDLIGVHRHRRFYLDQSGNGTWDGSSYPDGTYVFGKSGDIPISGRWGPRQDVYGNPSDADQIGVYRGDTFSFLLDLNGNGRWDGIAGGDAIRRLRGASGDRPVVGDWNGDGIDDIGTRRNNRFRLDRNGNGRWDGVSGGDVVYVFGSQDDLPVQGDFNGDGVDEIGVFRPSNRTFYLDVNGNGRYDGNGDGKDAAFVFRDRAETPITGDWNQDGVDEVGVRVGRLFFIDLNASGRWDGRAGGDQVYALGKSSDTPIIGQWTPRPRYLWLTAAAPAQQFPRPDATVPPSDLEPITPAALAPVVEQGIGIWSAVPLTDQQRYALRHVDAHVTDLPDAALGRTFGTTIWIDSDAAGLGWNVETHEGPGSPKAVERTNSRSTIHELPSDPHSYHLLTAVLHELGHVLGYSHTDDGLMIAELQVGTRRLPDVAALDAAFADAI